jgi:hypothetical protein
MLGGDHEAKSNCVIGAVKTFVSHYHDDARANELCETFEEADLRDVCFKAAEEYYGSLPIKCWRMEVVAR